MIKCFLIGEKLKNPISLKDEGNKKWEAVTQEDKMKRYIVFEVEPEEIVKNIVIDIPQHVLLLCADRHITTILRHKYRHGRGEYGKLKVANEELKYVEI